MLIITSIVHKQDDYIVLQNSLFTPFHIYIFVKNAKQDDNILSNSGVKFETLLRKHDTNVIINNEDTLVT